MQKFQSMVPAICVCIACWLFCLNCLMTAQTFGLKWSQFLSDQKIQLRQQRTTFGASYSYMVHNIISFYTYDSICLACLFSPFFRICHGTVKKSRHSFDYKLKILCNPLFTLNSLLLFVCLFILVNPNKVFLTVLKLTAGTVISLLTSSLCNKTQCKLL